MPRPITPKRAPALAVLALALGAHVAPAAPATPSLTGAVVQGVNLARARHHLPLLRPDARLARTARVHALSMARYGFLAHDARNGAPWNQRVVRSARTEDVGEVLASLRDVSATLEAQTVVQAWLHSHEHRVVLLNARYGRIGVGRAWTVLGGHRTAVYTVDFAAN